MGLSRCIGKLISDAFSYLMNSISNISMDLTDIINDEDFDSRFVTIYGKIKGPN